MVVAPLLGMVGVGGPLSLCVAPLVVGLGLSLLCAMAVPPDLGLPLLHRLVALPLLRLGLPLALVVGPLVVTEVATL